MKIVTLNGYVVLEPVLSKQEDVALVVPDGWTAKNESTFKVYTTLKNHQKKNVIVDNRMVEQININGEDVFFVKEQFIVAIVE